MVSGVKISTPAAIVLLSNSPLLNASVFWGEVNVSECPNAETLTQSILTLPTHKRLAKTDLDFFINNLKKLN
jgi:dTDP-4-amino-4,6-dideoxygalactose transaminase